ncbi:prealbumin-like fold domain-containing protein [Weissella confusa]|uniref:SpaA-like prealbumin fold domain-containing protein n=1 Tax=Weissella confusa TaxID=1583 RepID=A0A4Z0S282_WEICO|nr:prealbumin-like fold domain-containing protein [Weissella confusa]TGE75752.1 hypothetical protein C6P11_01070 [Weissella confusa]
MAKWKNALLISTIVAPIAFGASPLGDALAAPKDARPTSTPVVLHKQLTSDSNTSHKGDTFWGNGHEATPTNPFTEANGWKAAGAGYEFTAYQVPEKVGPAGSQVKLISFPKNSNSTPKVADVQIGNLTKTDGSDLLWSDVIEVNAEPAKSTAHDASNEKTDYVVQYSLSIDMDYQAQLKTYLDANHVEMFVDKTDASGAARFDGSDGNKPSLENGNWIILETDTPKDAGINTIQQGMVLSLPMMDAASITADEPDANKYWFGDAGSGYGANILNLYPKDIASLAKVDVTKTGSKSDLPQKDFYYTVFVADETQLANVKAAIAAALPEGSSANNVDLSTVIAGQIGQNFIQTVGTDTTGKASFTGLDPVTQLGAGQSYYIVESKTPVVADADEPHYLLDATIQQIVFDNSDTTPALTPDDVKVPYSGGTWDVNNYMPGIDKSITIGSGEDTDTAGQGTKNGGDTTNGVDRGEDFIWNIVSDLSVDASDYNKKYEIDDTIPYQTNWTAAKVAVAGIDDVFELEHILPNPSNGGLTGHAITYGNNDNPSTTGGTANGALNSAYLKLTVPNGTYAKLANVTAAKAILDVAGVTNDTTLQTFLNTNVTVSGVSSKYHFEENNRLAVKDADGQLTIAVQEQGRELFSALAAAQTDTAKRVMNIALTAHANSAAQASINDTTDITNKVDFDVENDYDVSTDKDTVKTFDAGWEIVKTDGSGQPLAGAGFDLAVEIPNGTEKADKVKRAALLNNFFHGEISQGEKKGQHVYDQALYNYAVTVDGEPTTIGALWEGMFLDAAKSDQFKTGYDTSGLTDDDAIKALAYNTTDANSLYNELVSMMTATDYETDGQNVLYFMHKDAATGAYMPEMDMGATGVVMGDVIWTPVRAWATTHVTGDDGYLQYCGLAAGKYALIEKTAPEGYALIDNEVQLGNETYAHAETFTLGSKGVGVLDGGTGKIDGKPTADDIHIENYQKSMFPLVGGIGTLFAVIAGLLAMGLALLKRKKDMKNEA